MPVSGQEVFLWPGKQGNSFRAVRAHGSFAFRLGATPRLAALRETSILFGTAIAVIFLKERLTKFRLGGILAIAIGAIVLIAAR